MTTANLAVLLGGCFVFVVVLVYILNKLFPWDVFHTDYQEPRAHKPIEATVWAAPIKIEGGDVMFDPTQPPKRKYTKRSKYWTDKRKKAVAAKARKTKPK
jgi:hypothetical protein